MVQYVQELPKASLRASAAFLLGGFEEMRDLHTPSANRHLPWVAALHIEQSEPVGRGPLGRGPFMPHEYVVCRNYQQECAIS